MITKQFKLLGLLLVCLVSPLFSENESAKVNPFVRKVVGAGQVIDAIQTSDGGYVSISRTGDTTCIVRNVTASGKKIWESLLSFQVSSGGFARVNGIAQTNEGYVLVGDGQLSGYYGPNSAIVIALLPDGTVKWNKSFTPTDGSISFYSVTSRPDGGFIVTGAAYPPDLHPILVKFTSTGDIQWEKAFENLSYDFLSQPVFDGLILASELSNNAGRAIGANVMKVDDFGHAVWKKTLKINHFSLRSLGPTADNGVVLAGISTNSTSLSVIALDAKGKLDWKAQYSLNVPGFFISNLIQTPDGGYAVTGAMNDKSGATKGGFLLKIDAQQNLVFQKVFVRGIQEDARSVFATKEGGYVLFGSSGVNDMLFLSLNSDGIVPGCSFFHQIHAKKVSPGPVTSDRLIVRSTPLSLPTAGTFQLSSAPSSESSSTVCQ